jgi:protein-L-isoaspartate(D-aspartate) O-methyltransferase
VGELTPSDEAELARARAALVAELRALGIRDGRVLAAMGRVPRHRFVPLSLLAFAYEDRPLPIGFDQTISQPYIVALSTEALDPAPTDRVLEVGTGSGYQTAILAELAGEVYTIERLPELARAARARLTQLGYRNIQVRVGDGTKGWPEAAPFPAIVVTAAAPRAPQSLLHQLGDGGRLVIPIGGKTSQDLWLIEKRGEQLVHRCLCPCTFVPLIGEEGWM